MPCTANNKEVDETGTWLKGKVARYLFPALHSLENHYHEPHFSQFALHQEDSSYLHQLHKMGLKCHPITWARMCFQCTCMLPFYMATPVSKNFAVSVQSAFQ